MKTLVTSYTFDADNSTVTINGVDNLSIEKILLITNVTRGIIIFNFADISNGGTLSSNILTLYSDTSEMLSTDKLQIFVDVENSNLVEMLELGLVEIVRQLQSIRNDGGIADTGGRVRCNIETGTLPTVTTVSTVSNTNAFGGYNAGLYMMSTSNLAAKALRNGILIS